MLKKTMTYTDYDGVQRTESFYFNLTKAEIVEMEYDIEGGMQKMLEEIVEKLDGKKIMAFVKKVILKAYGEKSADGKRFVKSEELSLAFAQTEAYSDLYIELVSDAKALADFVNAIIPQVEGTAKVDVAAN